MADFSDNTLFRGLAPDLANALLPLAEPVSFLKGSRLVKQGEPARGAWLIREGTAEVRVILPAGGERVVASVPSNGIFGESALFETAACNASVYAATNLDGWFLPGESFRALVMGRNAAALAIQRNVTTALVNRLAELNRELTRHPAPEDRPPAASPPDGDPLAGVARITHDEHFDYRAFLPLLPFFEGMRINDIEAVTAETRALALPRGAWLFAAGQPVNACYLVVRGAVEATRSVGAPERPLERRIAVLPPGALAGYLSLLAGHPTHGAHARAREDCVLLEYPAAVFEGLYRGSDGPSIKFQHAIHRTLMTSLARSNSQLARLVTQQALSVAVRDSTVGLR